MVKPSAEVTALLNDPGLAVPTAPATTTTGDIAWLRATVSRFRNGPVHARRRALVEAELATMDPDRLHSAAFALAQDLVTTGRVEVMGELARVVPAWVLAGELGSAELAGWVRTVAAAYPLAAPVTAAADGAVARLVAAYGGLADERTAVRISLLVQACDATAGLIGNAVLAMARSASSVAATVFETLRADPPVRLTTRVDRDGAVLPVPLTDAPFGAGFRACPGAEQAVAIAIGVVEAVRGGRLVTAEIEYEQSANLRVPVRVEVELP